MTSTIKTNIINSTAAVVAVLFTIGLLNMHEVVPVIDYVNDHTSGWITFLYYGGAAFILFFFPLVVGAAIEVPLWESKTRIGQEVANAMTNARDNWLSFFAFGLAGGMVTFFASWGIIAIICN